MPKWIDVKDRLPDTTDTVIVRMKIDLLDNDQKLLATMPEIYVGKYTSHGWIFCHPDHTSGWKQYDDSHTGCGRARLKADVRVQTYYCSFSTRGRAYIKCK